ncbi:transcriptional regulator, AraC family [Pseudooceanicola nitratireducens]|uniref:Transcriptional regulator, AraC family n=2 Tax=Pseudooceanicola nitratireducens TaxID=517719 RepID=A0A1I1JX39_9RHOB|nr:AraC-type DNA-binding protein [Pseudooceanicola nitratireducens]SFC52945.1 transcriptional regulator, AraC family [Pseudooceanicola nitratireducens]
MGRGCFKLEINVTLAQTLNMAQAMHLALDGLLAGFPILRTEDLSEAREVVGRAFCDHRLDIRQGTRLAVQHDHIGGAELSLNALGYGAEVAIDPGRLEDFYLLQFPLRGQARITHRGEVVEAGAQVATILNPDRETTMIWGQGCRKLLLQVNKGLLDRAAESLIGAPLPGAVRFDPRVDLTRAGGQRLFGRVVAAARAAGDGDLWSGDPGLNEAWAELQLASVLLESQPSNVSHMLWRATRAPQSRQMRRALEYLHENIADPLRVEDIAKAAGLNVRSLQLGFKSAFGVSPMRYLRDVRLDMARYMLARRLNRASVTEVAYSVGFSHLGRFSRDYRDRFGESPSVVQ